MGALVVTNYLNLIARLWVAFITYRLSPVVWLYFEIGLVDLQFGGEDQLSVFVQFSYLHVSCCSCPLTITVIVNLFSVSHGQSVTLSTHRLQLLPIY